MTAIRQTLGIKPRDDTPAPEKTAGKFKVTLTGPLKGPKPITFLIEAPSAKQATLDLKRLFLTGKPTVEPA